MGAGSWGTAFSLMCVDAGQETVLWARRADVAEEIRLNRTNTAYLPDIELPAMLTATDDPDEAMTGADTVVLAVPSVGLADQLSHWGTSIPREATLTSLVKGVTDETLQFGSQVIINNLDCDPNRVVVVSGPNLAGECARRLPAASVASCPDVQRALHVQSIVMAPYFRVYTNEDRTGVEVGGAVKNVIALAAGMAYGMGFGANTMAAVITRGLAEMTRLGVALGGRALTFSGLAGVGDLMVTCTSPQSRNRTVGERLGRGERLDAIVSSMRMVAEGVKSSRGLLALARTLDVDMPITQGVVAVCHHDQDPRAMAEALLAREAKPEIYGMDV